MKITEDVIRDLLPLYQAGEASEDTRALVESWLSEHPGLAEEVKRAEIWSLPAVTRTNAEAAERAALRRTQVLLARRSWLAGAAVFFSLLPLSFRVDDTTGFHWLFWPDLAPVASASFALAAAAWVAFAICHRSLRPGGF